MSTALFLPLADGTSMRCGVVKEIVWDRDRTDGGIRLGGGVGERGKEQGLPPTGPDVCSSSSPKPSWKPR